MRQIPTLQSLTAKILKERAVINYSLEKYWQVLSQEKFRAQLKSVLREHLKSSVNSGFVANNYHEEGLFFINLYQQLKKKNPIQLPLSAAKSQNFKISFVSKRIDFSLLALVAACCLVDSTLKFPVDGLEKHELVQAILCANLSDQDSDGFLAALIVNLPFISSRDLVKALDDNVLTISKEIRIEKINILIDNLLKIKDPYSTIDPDNVKINILKIQNLAKINTRCADKFANRLSEDLLELFTKVLMLTNFYDQGVKAAFLINWCVKKLQNQASDFKIKKIAAYALADMAENARIEDKLLALTFLIDLPYKHWDQSRIEAVARIAFTIPQAFHNTNFKKELEKNILFATSLEFLLQNLKLPDFLDSPVESVNKSENPFVEPAPPALTPVNPPPKNHLCSYL